MSKNVHALVAMVAAAVIGTTTLVGGTALADQDAARQAFQDARAKYKAGAYDEAAVLLVKAYKLKPHPALLRYLGSTFYKLNRAQEAIAAFKRYLKEAPQAPDREKIAAKVRELEMVLGVAEEDDDSAAAPVPAPVAVPAPDASKPAAPAAGAKVNLAPTGDDDEVPEVLGDKPGHASVPASGQHKEEEEGSSSSVLTVMKWVAMGVGIGGLAAGSVFMGLASSKASDLEAAVVASGNPTKDSPQVAYSREHHDLQEAYKRNKTLGIVSFVAGGVAAGAAITLFLIDRSTGERSAKSNDRRVAVAPFVGGNAYGVAGQLSF